jgi:hypothetical protein
MQFDTLYNKIITEMVGEMPSNIQVIKDIITDEFISEGFVFADNLDEYLPKIETYILNGLEMDNGFSTNISFADVDYMDLVELVKEAFDSYNLVVAINDPEEDTEE